MITVICSKCGELIESTRRSVVLPFVCGRCDAEKAEVDAFYDAMTPKEPKCAKGEPTESLTDEFASVENTTRLIEDLEAQLGAVQKERDRLKRENERLQGKVADYFQHISAGRETIKELNEQSQLWRNTLEYEVKQKTSQRDAAISSRDFDKREADMLRYFLEQERNRSLWSILRERVGF